tara:strand:+ start:1225 stop:2019 length:795 start_codon:yes stop_codon:yes gene_type:complete
MSRVRGLSLVGLLITMACIVVLLSITLPAIRTATTGMSGAGGQSTSSAWATTDRVNLNALGQSMLAGGLGTGFDAAWISPASVTRAGDIGWNTTANVYSLLIMEQRVQPTQLVSRGDRGLVEVDTDYDYTVYDPRGGVHWDPAFTADLARGSNVSWAHMPLQGARFDNHWRSSMSESFPIFGSRGPRDGIPTVNSVTCPEGAWSGSVWFADGSVDGLQSIGAWSGRINGVEDNLFRVDDLQRGADGVLGFTQFLDEDGVELQWD